MTTAPTPQNDVVDPATRVQAIYLALMALFEALGGDRGTTGLPADLRSELSAADLEVARQLSQVILSEIEAREGTSLDDLPGETVKQYTLQLAQSAQQAQQEATQGNTADPPGSGGPAGGMPS